MPIDWHGFLSLAQSLQEQAAAATDPEPYLRSAVSANRDAVLASLQQERIKMVAPGWRYSSPSRTPVQSPRALVTSSCWPTGQHVMPLRGHVENGVVVFDEPGSLPDGTAVRVEPASAGDAFWQSLSLDELCRRQGVPPLTAADDLAGGWPPDDLDDGFEAAVRHWRAAETDRGG